MRLFTLFAAFCAVASAQTEISSCGFVVATNGALGNPHIYTVTADLVQSPGVTCIDLSGRKDIVLDGAGHTLTYVGGGIDIENTSRIRITGFLFDTTTYDATSPHYAAIWKQSGTQRDTEVDNNIFRSFISQTAKANNAMSIANVSGNLDFHDNVVKFWSQIDNEQNVISAFTPEAAGAVIKFTDNLIYIDGNILTQGNRSEVVEGFPAENSIFVVRGNKFQFASAATRPIFGGNTEAVAAFCNEQRLTGQDPGNTGVSGSFIGPASEAILPQFYFENDIVSYSPSRLITPAGCDGAAIYRNRIWFRGLSCIGLIRPRDSTGQTQIYENYLDYTGSPATSCPAISFGANFSQRGVRDSLAWDNTIVGSGGAKIADYAQNAQRNRAFNNSASNLSGEAVGFFVQLDGGGDEVASGVVSAVVNDPGSGFTTSPTAFVETVGGGGGVELELSVSGGSITGVNVTKIGHNFKWLCPGGGLDRSCGMAGTPRVIVQGDGVSTFPTVTLTIGDIPDMTLLEGVNDNTFEYNALTGTGFNAGKYTGVAARLPENSQMYTPTSMCGSTVNGGPFDDTNIFNNGLAAEGAIGLYPPAGQCECETTMPATQKRFFNEATGLPDVAGLITCGPTVGARVDLGTPMAPDVPALIEARIAEFSEAAPPNDEPPASLANRRARGNATMRGAGKLF